MSHRPPLLDDPGASPRARAALGAGRADLPSAERMDAIAARVAASLGGPPPGSSGAPPADPSPPVAPAPSGALLGSSAAGKAAGVVALAAAGTGLWWVFGTPARPPATPAAVVSSAVVNTNSAHAVQDRDPGPVAAPLAETVATTPPPSAGAPAASASSPPAPRGTVSPSAPAPRRSVVPAASASASAAPTETEAAMLARAQGLLGQDPATALSITEGHQRSFPAAMLVEEREVIAVDALVRLGRRDEARARVAQVRARFPRSAYLPRLEALVAAR